MKNKTTVILGYIHMIILLFGVAIFSVWFYYDLSNRIFGNGSDFGLSILSSFACILGLYSGLQYLITTKFWLKTKDELKDLEKENQILTKKIEQKELLDKLNKPK